MSTFTVPRTTGCWLRNAFKVVRLWSGCYVLDACLCLLFDTVAASDSLSLWLSNFLLFLSRCGHVCRSLALKFRPRRASVWWVTLMLQQTLDQLSCCSIRSASGVSMFRERKNSSFVCSCRLAQGPVAVGLDDPPIAILALREQIPTWHMALTRPTARGQVQQFAKSEGDQRSQTRDTKAAKAWADSTARQSTCGRCS